MLRLLRCPCGERPAIRTGILLRDLNQRNANVTKFSKLLRTGAAVLAIAAAVNAAPRAAHAQVDVPLIESGSSLLYPLFNAWVGSYTASNPSADITTTSTGSGAGIAQAIQGLVQIGASDAYLSNTIVKKNPTMLSIPLAISKCDWKWAEHPRTT